MLVMCGWSRGKLLIQKPVCGEHFPSNLSGQLYYSDSATSQFELSLSQVVVSTVVEFWEFVILATVYLFVVFEGSTASS